MARLFLPWFIIFPLLASWQALAADTFRVAEYNVENYLEEPSATRPPKSDTAKSKVREGILALKPDVLALEEIGSPAALRELQGSLKKAGLDLPESEFVTGHDTNVHVAVLSRFPIIARHPHTNESFLLGGRRFRVSRGFAEVTIRVSQTFAFDLIAAHLKSRLPSAAADEAELRFQEARLLREIIDARFSANPNVNLVVLGDFNDVQDSEPIKTILGARGKKGLIDTRPAERNGDNPSRGDRHISSREITWTAYYAKQDTFSRVDYILLSPAMSRLWEPTGTYILTLPDWGTASDHRPLVASFTTPSR